MAMFVAVLHQPALVADTAPGAVDPFAAVRVQAVGGLRRVAAFHCKQEEHPLLVLTARWPSVGEWVPPFI